MNLSNLKISTRLYGGFFLVVGLLIILQTNSYFNFSSLEQAMGLNAHSFEVLGEADQMLTSLLNIEAGQRGFELTGNDSSLAPLTAGKKAFQQHYDKVKSLTSDNPAQQERLNKLEALQREWLTAGIEPATGAEIGKLSSPIAAGAKTGFSGSAVLRMAPTLML